MPEKIDHIGLLDSLRLNNCSLITNRTSIVDEHIDMFELLLDKVCKYLDGLLVG